MEMTAQDQQQRVTDDDLERVQYCEVAIMISNVCNVIGVNSYFVNAIRLIIQTYIN